jgi:hypothetical protein
VAAINVALLKVGITTEKNTLMKNTGQPGAF